MVQFALARSRSTGKMVHICQLAHLQGASDVVRAKYRMEFECPECQNDMVPAVGEVNQHHFRHKGGHSCLEDSKAVDRINKAGLRQWIQERIEGKKQLLFPSLRIPIWELNMGDDIPDEICRAISRSHGGSISYGTAQICHFQSVLVADPYAKLQPHLLCTALDGKQYAVELRSAGGISDAKEEMLRKLDLPVLVIDISNADYLLWKANEQEIDKYLDEHTHWEVYPEQSKAYEDAAQTLRQEALDLMAQWEQIRYEEQNRRNAEKAAMKNTHPGEPWDIELEDMRRKEELESEEAKEAKLRIALQTIDFGKNEQVRINGTRWAKCWHCGEVKPEGVFVMCQYARGLCRECHFDEGVKPRWQ